KILKLGDHRLEPLPRFPLPRLERRLARPQGLAFRAQAAILLRPGRRDVRQTRDRLLHAGERRLDRLVRHSRTRMSGRCLFHASILSSRTMSASYIPGEAVMPTPAHCKAEKKKDKFFCTLGTRINCFSEMRGARRLRPATSRLTRHPPMVIVTRNLWGPRSHRSTPRIVRNIMDQQSQITSSKRMAKDRK